MSSFLPRALFGATIFASAFLLFLVQPLIAKQILPWFGGSAAVWSICMVFFQVTLLGGYAYADLIARRLSVRMQLWVHGTLLLASLAFLPIVAGSQWKPQGSEDPSLWILGLLLSTIGLPYFLLSTTGPLIQSWVARTPLGAQVYRYFSLSNLASLLALVAYPFLIEPRARLLDQALAWSWVYGVFAVLCMACGRYVLGQVGGQGVKDLAAQGSPAAPGAPLPGWRDCTLWLALSAIGSWLLLAVTNHITQNVASIPFLWLLPLTLYLLTFVLCFESDRWYRRRLVVPAAAVALALCAWGLYDSGVGLNVRVAVPVYAVGLFLFCMVAHGELAQRRPQAAGLTRFYLMMSLGGALGGVLVGLVAPRVLPGYYELGLGFVMLALMGWWILAPLVPKAGWRRAWVALAALGCAVLLGLQVHGDAAGSRIMGRNFYGTLLTVDVLREDPRESVRQIYHGSVKHGEQFVDAARRRELTAYYGTTSGVGRAIAQIPEGPRHIGLIGLGAGTLAAYGRSGDRLRFYEINPAVLEVARTEFSFISDAPAQVQTVIADARLALEREEAQGFDVLAVDAFSGDSVPVHLLTLEAMRVYLKHMKPDGIIAFHLTNRFLWMPPVVERLARELGLAAVLVHDEAEGNDALRRTDWMLVARRPEVLARTPIAGFTKPIEPATPVSLWTDDFNNLFEILK